MERLDVIYRGGHIYISGNDSDEFSYHINDNFEDVNVKASAFDFISLELAEWAARDLIDNILRK